MWPLLIAAVAGLWGDANQDGAITALDALMCLSVAVELDLPEGADPALCDVAPDADAGFDGTVTSRDALAILSYVVGKEIPAEMRVGEPVALP